MAQSELKSTGSDLGFEAELFKAADKLRGKGCWVTVQT